MIFFLIHIKCLLSKRLSPIPFILYLKGELFKGVQCRQLEGTREREQRSLSVAGAWRLAGMGGAIARLVGAAAPIKKT
jgi:hypothetical protein